MQPTDRGSGAGELSASGAAEAGKGCGHVNRADFPADAGRCASFSQEPGRGLLSGAATGTEKLRPERTADAHQQGRRALSENFDVVGCASHSGPAWTRE